MNRRRFLQRGVAVTAGTYAALSSFEPLVPRVRGANDEIRVAVAGIKSRGGAHVNHFQGLEGVRVVALCDPDKQILEKGVESFKKKYGPAGAAIQGYADIRAILDRKDVDALVIAAPNHWHSLMTVWACQAGKHVYVEKPVSHAIWEGRKMVEAARKYNRIVQAGTQHRSCPGVQEAARDLQAGKYGKVLWVHCSVLHSRAGIGRVTEPQPVLEFIDYNLWAGPAPMTPVMRQQFHYDWHWQWNWGDGEMANWGIHYLDDVRHLLGWKDVPTKVVTAATASPGTTTARRPTCTSPSWITTVSRWSSTSATCPTRSARAARAGRCTLAPAAATTFSANTAPCASPAAAAGSTTTTANVSTNTRATAGPWM